MSSKIWTLMNQIKAVVPRIFLGVQQPMRWFRATTTNTTTNEPQRLSVPPQRVRQLNAQATPVSDRLLLGASRIAEDRALLRRLGVSHICNATIEVPRYFKESRNLAYFKTGWYDDNKAICTPQEYHAAFDFIHGALVSDAAHVVLVHCLAGRSRSASIVLYYLCRSQNLSLQQGMLKLYAMRPIVMINDILLRCVAQTLAHDAGQDTSEANINLVLEQLAPNFVLMQS